MTPTDQRARVNRRALERPDPGSFIIAPDPQPPLPDDGHSDQAASNVLPFRPAAPGRTT